MKTLEGNILSFREFLGKLVSFFLTRKQGELGDFLVLFFETVRREESSCLPKWFSQVLQNLERPSFPLEQPNSNLG